MRPRSELSPRSVRGACPPGINTPTKVASSSLEMDENGLGEARLLSIFIFSTSLLSRFLAMKLPM